MDGGAPARSTAPPQPEPMTAAEEEKEATAAAKEAQLQQLQSRTMQGASTAAATHNTHG